MQWLMFGFRHCDVLTFQIQVENRNLHLLLADEIQRARDARGRSDQLAPEFVEHILDQHRNHHLVFDDEDLAIR